jgi:hypothetical protein
MLLCRVSAASRACCLARPKGRNFRLVGPVGHALCVEQNDSKPLTPSSALSNRADVSYGSVGHLALLGQGPLGFLSPSSVGRAEGVGEEK